MRRRDLIAAGTTVAVAAVAAPAFASGSSSETPAEALSVNLVGVGLPVIADGRVRNYVFITVRVTLGPNGTLEAVRAKDAYFRDALVRASHRVPFTAGDNWTRLNENAVNAAVMAIADVVCGLGAVIKSEVLIQAPRRRSGMQTA
jgi:hypothetical protein